MKTALHNVYPATVLRILLPGIACMVLALSVHAQIARVPPFHGSLRESWESFPTRCLYSNNMVTPPLAIMRGHAVIFSGRLLIYQPRAGFAWHLGAFDEIGSVMAGVADGRKAMGVESDADDTTAPTGATVEFDQPVSSFGGYWATSLYADQANFNFLFHDASGRVIASERVTYRNFHGTLEWHGWQSTIPIKSVTFLGFAVAVDRLEAKPFREDFHSVRRDE